jgi:hypothetical protein
LVEFFTVAPFDNNGHLITELSISTTVKYTLMNPELPSEPSLSNETCQLFICSKEEKNQ